LLRHTGALAQGITIQERQARFESKADAWLAWFQREMASRNCSDPDELLPDACARLEAIIEDRVALARQKGHPGALAEWPLTRTPD
jgi:hypothetical protein